MRIFSLLGVLLLLASCVDEMNYLPKTNFHGEIDLTPKNPAQLFTKEFAIKDVDYQGPEQKYAVIYKSDKKFTTIIDQVNEDTLFQGFCYNSNDVWYFKYPLSDTTFWLSAITEKNNQLLGWPISWAQMYKVDSLVKTESLKVDTMDSRYSLKPSKQNIDQVYKELFTRNPSSRFQLIRKQQEQYKPSRRVVNGGKDVITDISPNLDEGHVSVRFKESGDYLVKFFVKGGLLMMEENVENKDFVQLDISLLDEGFHIMEINDSRTGNLLVRSEIFITN